MLFQTYFKGLHGILKACLSINIKAAITPQAKLAVKYEIQTCLIFMTFSVYISVQFSRLFFFSFSLYFWLYTPIFSALHRLRLYPWFELWAHLGFARNFFLFSQYFIDILKTRLSLTMGHSYSYLKKIHSIFLCSTLFMFLPQ